MFKTLKTIIAPKSFDLENFISKAKKYQKINSTFKKRIEEKIALQDSSYLRSGKLAKATLCGHTILTLTDENLSKALYIAINSEGFWDKIEDLRFAQENSLFKDLKFFIDEKQKKVLHISYASYRSIKHECFDCAFAKLTALKEHLSLSCFGFDLDYKKFFTSYLHEYTSFLTSFFISIVSGTYEFDCTKLLNIAQLFYESSPLYKMDQNGLKGIYVNDFGYCFPSYVPRNLRINIFKLLSNNNSFDSYEAFFTSYPNEICEPYFSLTDNFVFNEKLLISSLKKQDETDSLVTYKTSYRSTHYVIVKFKESSKFSDYIKILYHNVSLFEYVAVAPTPDFTAYYLLFKYTNTKKLREAIIKSNEETLKAILCLVNSSDLVIPFKPNTSMIDCFDSSLHLLPTQISSVDFESKALLDHHLFIMQVIKVFIEANSIDVADIFKYSFMKLLPYSFAIRLIDYLKTGNYDNQISKSPVQLLTSKHISRVKFLHEISNAHSASFISEATSLPRVQELIRVRNLAVPVGCFNASSDCFSDSLMLLDDTLSELFDYSNPEFQHITDVIISEDFVKDGHYAILGVIWKYSNLRTIHSVINEGINSKQLYTMICSLATKKYDYLEYLSSDSAISTFLVDQNFNVFINPKVLGNRNKYKQIPGRTQYRKNYYYTVVNAFSSLIQSESKWHAFDHFGFDELLHSFDMTTVYSLKFCKEHGHYHLPDIFCPKCEKIYERTDRLKWYNLPFPSLTDPNRACSSLEYCYPKNQDCCQNEFTLITFTRNSEKLLAEVKIGLENNLYDDYFFHPIKIAIDSEPFGILCTRIDINACKFLSLHSFQNIQRLKAVLLLYKTILPKILSGKFITSNIEMFTSIRLHKDHPGQIVILNLPLMECSSVIQNNKDEKILKTKQLFAEFLIDYIANVSSLDKFGESNISQLVNDIRSLNFSEQAVMDCIETFCIVHNMPALPNHRICPICKSNGISEENIEVLPEAHFKKLEASEATYEGGEANLYPDSNSKVTKLFKGNVDLILKSKIIGKALSISSRLEEFNKTHADIQFVPINEVLYSLSSQGVKLRGYSLSFINDSFKISRLKDKEFAESNGYSRIDILNILIKVCIGIEFLHSLGVYIGDLNGGNILIKDKTIYFIDIDGMSFGDVKNFIYTDTYIYPPSAANQNITMDDDWYSLAIQAFYYLTYSHPFRGVCERDNVSSNVVERMTQGHSVLGEHGIVPPSINIGWDFMPSYLVAFFLQTFEGTRRENMRNVLEAFLAELTTPATVNNGFTKSSRLSECKLAISEKLYLSDTNSVIWNENVIISADNNPMFVKNCGNYFIFKTISKTIVVNDNTGRVFNFSQIIATDKCFAMKNKLFYLSDNDTVLKVESITESSGISAVQTINRATTQKIVDLFVTSSRKFIFLEEEDETHYAIYCNLQKLTSLDIALFGKAHISSSILYDTLSGKYLVILSANGQTVTVTINTDGSYTTTTLPFEISQSKCYYGSTLYYVVNGQIQFCRLDYSQNGNIPLDFVTGDSLIYHQGNKFIVCNQSETYIRLKP